MGLQKMNQSNTTTQPWITGTAFIPQVGKSYAVHFGQINYQGVHGNVSARIRIDGEGVANWIDLDTGKTLDSAVSKYAVQAYFCLPSVQGN